MSQYSSIIDRFIKGALLPEIDALNLKLASMEEFSYDGPEISAMRAKVNKLIPIYDFLHEYNIGDEICELSTLETLMSITGLGILSSDSSQPVIESTLTNDVQPSGLNYQDAAYLSILVDGKIFDGSPIDAANEHTIIFSAVTDIDILTVNGTTNTTNRYSFINEFFSVGPHSYSVVLTRDDETVFSKTIIIEAI